MRLAQRIARGQRWDSSVSGSGFGLAISQELAIATGSRLSLAALDGGGLRAKIEWAANLDHPKSVFIDVH